MNKWQVEPASRNRSDACDRCRQHFQDSYSWPGLGIPLVLCNACRTDIEESVGSYGEDPLAARLRLLSRLREVGT